MVDTFATGNLSNEIIHPLSGVAAIEMIECEPVRFSHPIIGQPKKNLNDFGFPLKVQHAAFHQKPLVVLHSLRLSTLLTKAPAHFDNFELDEGLFKAVELKSKRNTRMQLKLWETGLEHGLGGIIIESLLEQLTGERKESEPFEISGSEEPQPMEKPSIKSQLLSGLVA